MLRSLRTVCHFDSLGFINCLLTFSSEIPSQHWHGRQVSVVENRNESPCRANRRRPRPSTRYRPHNPLLIPAWIDSLPTMVHIHLSLRAPRDRLRPLDHQWIDILPLLRVRLVRRCIVRKVHAPRCELQMKEDLVSPAVRCVLQGQG